jgi:hypothetical protein
LCILTYRFQNVDRNWVKLMGRARENPFIVGFCNGDELVGQLLPHLLEQLEFCIKSLKEVGILTDDEEEEDEDEEEEEEIDVVGEIVKTMEGLAAAADGQGEGNQGPRKSMGPDGKPKQSLKDKKKSLAADGKPKEGRKSTVSGDGAPRPSSATPAGAPNKDVPRKSGAATGGVSKDGPPRKSGALSPGATPNDGPPRKSTASAGGAPDEEPPRQSIASPTGATAPDEGEAPRGSRASAGGGAKEGRKSTSGPAPPEVQPNEEDMPPATE